MYIKKLVPQSNTESCGDCFLLMIAFALQLLQISMAVAAHTFREQIPGEMSTSYICLMI